MYNDFVRIAPEDPDRYVLQYKIIKAQHTGLQDQIGALEELARHDYREKWALELAKLYRKAGEDFLCVQECEEIVAFFGDGPYVIKALEMKASITELDPEEVERLAFLKAGGSYEPAFEESAPDQGADVSSLSAGEAAAEEAPAEEVPTVEVPTEEIPTEEIPPAGIASEETVSFDVEAPADTSAQTGDTIVIPPLSEADAEASAIDAGESESAGMDEAAAEEPAASETAEADEPAAPVSDDTAPYTTRLGGGRVNITGYTDADEEPGGITNVIPDLSRPQKKTDRAPIRVKAEEEPDQVSGDTVPVSLGKGTGQPRERQPRRG